MAFYRGRYNFKIILFKLLSLYLNFCVSAKGRHCLILSLISFTRFLLLAAVSGGYCEQDLNENLSYFPSGLDWIRQHMHKSQSECFLLDVYHHCLRQTRNNVNWKTITEETKKKKKSYCFKSKVARPVTVKTLCWKKVSGMSWLNLVLDQGRHGLCKPTSWKLLVVLRWTLSHNVMLYDTT